MSIFRTIVLMLMVAMSCNAMSATDKNKMKIRGTPEQVKQQISKDFPVGMDQDKVITVLTEKYGVERGKIIVNRVNKTPVTVTVDGVKTKEYSWIYVTISEYRTYLFITNYITVNFAFDGENRLLSFGIITTKGPNL